MLAAGNAANVERVWSLALVAGLLAGIGYLLFAAVSRFATPWTTGRSSS
jgi:ABC-type nitrate/sulfonate/bicarbonate transport system permease component